MPDWDDDSALLEANLVDAQRAAVAHALARRTLTAADVKAWHAITMRGLDSDDAYELGIEPADLAGAFRGSRKLPDITVHIGDRSGVAPANVGSECKKFFGTLKRLLSGLDQRFPTNRLDDMEPDGLLAVAEAAAWAHSEWVRIHPYVNGNGRTARLIANALLVRYGLPPIFRLRPRPEGSYAFAASESMNGSYRAMAGYVVAQLLQKGAA